MAKVLPPSSAANERARNSLYPLKVYVRRVPFADLILVPKEADMIRLVEVRYATDASFAFRPLSYDIEVSFDVLQHLEADDRIVRPGNCRQVVGASRREQAGFAGSLSGLPDGFFAEIESVIFERGALQEEMRKGAAPATYFEHRSSIQANNLLQGRAVQWIVVGIPEWAIVAVV